MGEAWASVSWLSLVKFFSRFIAVIDEMPFPTRYELYLSPGGFTGVNSG